MAYNVDACNKKLKSMIRFRALLFSRNVDRHTPNGDTARAPARLALQLNCDPSVQMRPAMVPRHSKKPAMVIPYVRSLQSCLPLLTMLYSLEQCTLAAEEHLVLFLELPRSNQRIGHPCSHHVCWISANQYHLLQKSLLEEMGGLQESSVDNDAAGCQANLVIDDRVQLFSHRC